MDSDLFSPLRDPWLLIHKLRESPFPLDFSYHGRPGLIEEQSFPLISVRLRATVPQVRIRNFAHKGLKIKNPPHPGEFIRTEIIEPAGLTVTAAAKALRVSRPTLSSLLNGKADLSGEMALRIEKAFGVNMDTLMRMQSSYDIAQTRKREKQISVPRFSSLAAAP